MEKRRLVIKHGEQTAIKRIKLQLCLTSRHAGNNNQGS